MKRNNNQYKKRRLTIKEIAEAIKVLIEILQEDAEIKKWIVSFCVLFSIIGFFTLGYNYYYDFVDTQTTTVEKTYSSSDFTYVNKPVAIHAYAIFTEDNRCYFLRDTADVFDVNLFEATVEPGMTIQVTYKTSAEHRKDIPLVGVAVNDYTFFDFDTIRIHPRFASFVSFCIAFNLPIFAYGLCCSVISIKRHRKKTDSIS